MLKGHAVPEVVTGKPISVGGSIFRREATGAGVVMTTERACHRLGVQLDTQRCVVQGFGNVGGVAATELYEQGATVIASPTSPAACTRPAGSSSRSCTRTSSSTAHSRGTGAASGYPTRCCSSCRATS